MFFRKILFFLVFLPVGVCVAQTPDSTEREPSPNEFVVVEQEPKSLNMDSVSRLIRYPDSCKKYKIQGKVFIKILVDKRGIPVKHVVKKTPHPLITKEMERHIYHIRFSPALDKGKPVMYWVTIPFDFKLK